MAADIPKLTRQFVRLHLANFAFYQVKLQAEHIMQSNFTVGDALLTPHMAGLVVTYAKNFTESEGIGPLPEMFSDLPDGIMRHTHGILMRSRHTLYAHRDVRAAKGFVYDYNYSSEPYEVEISFSKEKGLICYPQIPELSTEILPHVVSLCVFQSSRIFEEVEKLLPVLTNGKIYKEGVRYVIGKDFP